YTLTSKHFRSAVLSQYKTRSDSVKNRSSRTAAVCLVLLCVLLLTAVIVLGVHIHTNNTNYTEERDQLLTNITNLTEDRDELQTKINSLTEERDQLLTSITNLTEDRDELQTKINSLTEERDQRLNYSATPVKPYYCRPLWSFVFYYMSNERKSWTESRQDCKKRRADLIIINNREEQVSERYCVFWIGLTDIDVEGQWKWADGITLTSGFWGTGEPNGQRGENCIASYPSGWYDYPCSNAFKWICEKNFKNE
uniref:C-type lectin domain-containing protein n=1 Tax=Sinocyclocheilus rhinocerous TaxID=307959 RepID=A0A673K9A0_9TELE